MKAFFNAPEKSSGSLVEVKQSALQPHEDFLVRSFVAAGFHGEDTVPYRLAACSIFFLFNCFRSQTYCLLWHIKKRSSPEREYELLNMVV